MKRPALLLTSLALGCSSPASEPLHTPPAHLPPALDHTQDPPPPVEQRRQTLEVCTPIELWSTPVRVYGLAPRRPLFSPNGAVLSRGARVYQGGTDYFRLRDGGRIASVPDEAHDRDRAWRLGVRLDGDGVHVTPLHGGEVLLSIPQPSVDYGLFYKAVALSEDGARVAATRCVEAETVLESWEVAEGHPGPSIRLADRCNQEDWPDPRLRILSEDRALVVTTHRVHLVDLVAGVARSSPVIAGGTILTAEKDPAREILAVITHDGSLHQLSSATLEPVAPAAPVGVVRVNQNIYAPLIQVSPLAWSPGSALFARVDPEMNVVLEKANGEVHARIPPRILEHRIPEENLDAPVAFAFSPNGELLAISFEHTVALFGCAPSAAVPSEPGTAIPVRLEGPAFARIGQTVELAVIAPSSGAFRGYQFAIDGEPVQPPSAAPLYSWTAETAGTHRLSVVVDDGVSRGEASLVITVE